MSEIDKKELERLIGLQYPEAMPAVKQAESSSKEIKTELPAVNSEQLLQPLEKVGESSAGQKAAAKPTNTTDYKNLPHYAAVENILEEGLAEVYFGLPPQLQKEFRKQGEETTAQITRLLNSSKYKVGQIAKDIFNLILSWLKLIPGVNKFFLEQEVKIKSDRIIALKNNKNG